MKTLELKEFEVKEMAQEEMSTTEGGIFGLLVAYALQAVVVGALAAGVYYSYDHGYRDAK